MLTLCAWWMFFILGLVKTVHIHRISAYAWWLPCQKYCSYTVNVWFWPTLIIYTPNMAICLVVSLPKILFIHRACTVLANPIIQVKPQATKRASCASGTPTFARGLPHAPQAVSLGRTRTLNGTPTRTPTRTLNGTRVH